MSLVMLRRFTLGLMTLVAGGAAPRAPAQEKPSAEGLQAVITTADDEQLGTRITRVADGQLQLATDPPRSSAAGLR